MPIFGRKESPPPEPKPEPVAPAADAADPKAPTAPDDDGKYARLSEQVSSLTDTVSRFVEAQSRPPSNGNSSALPPIKDISDEDYDAALEEGGAAARKAISIRQNAITERTRREFSDQLAQVQGPGMAAINDLTTRTILKDDALYSGDAAIKKDVDAQITALKTQGVLISEEAVKWVLSKVKGDHTDRLLKADREQFVRQQRDETTAIERGKQTAKDVRNADAPQRPQDLTPDADRLLASRNRNRGLSADDFARSLPVRERHSLEHPGKRERFHYENWNEMMQEYESAQDEYEKQIEGVYGRR